MSESKTKKSFSKAAGEDKTVSANSAQSVGEPEDFKNPQAQIQPKKKTENIDLETTKQIEVKILDQSYRLVCAPENEAALLESVRLVDVKMQEVIAHSSIRGTDRIAVMAALSIASELIHLHESVRYGKSFPAKEIQGTIQQINQQLSAAIEQYDATST